MNTYRKLRALREEGRQLGGVAVSGHRAELLENVKTREPLFTDNH
jgi:hypothetical protein